MLRPTGEEVIGVELNRDARTWGMLCHLASLSGYIGVPLGNFIGPLLVYLIKKDEFNFVDDQGREALNFQLNMFVYALISGLLCLVVIGIVLLPLVLILDLVFTIIATMEASKGRRYRYPMMMFRAL